MFFKTHEHVPDIYTFESRDFQYISGIYNLIFNYIINNSDKIISMKSIQRIDESLLNALADYVGFEMKADFTSNELRYILSNFPYIIKNKGNIEGIRSAVSSIYLSQSFINNLEIEIPDDFYNTVNGTDIDVGTYTLNIIADNNVPNQAKLNNMLEYVRPIGVKLNNIFKFQNAYKSSVQPDGYVDNDLTNYNYDKDINSVVRKKDSAITDNFPNTVEARVGSTRVYTE